MESVHTSCHKPILYNPTVSPRRFFCQCIELPLPPMITMNASSEPDLPAQCSLRKVDKPSSSRTLRAASGGKNSSSSTTRLTSKIKHSLGKVPLLGKTPSSPSLLLVDDDSSLQSAATRRRRFKRRGSKSASMLSSTLSVTSFEALLTDCGNTTNDVGMVDISIHRLERLAIHDGRNDQCGSHHEDGAMHDSVTSLLTMGTSDGDASTSGAGIGYECGREEPLCDSASSPRNLGTYDGDASVASAPSATRLM
jgi:hypothetical protein